MTGLRLLTAEDAAVAAALIRLAFSTHSADPQPSGQRVTEQEVLGHLRAGGGGLVVGEPAAAVILWSEVDGALYLSRLAVHPDKRRQGLAQALIAAGLDEARRRGLPRVTLSTRLAFAGNRALFRAAGFTETGTRSHPGYDEPTMVDLVHHVTNCNEI